jgi:orotidine-5'-phosphate decarboxylase
MKKLILALDVANKEKAIGLVKSLSKWVDIFKVGPILFIKEGPAIIEEIKKLGKEVFLDLKFHDIPETVKKSVQSAADLGVYSLTVHSSGGKEMLAAVAKLEKRPKIWAVTVLTSQASDIDQVLRRAEIARAGGADGVIASAQEVRELKTWFGKDFTVVTPGIRLEEINPVRDTKTNENNINDIQNGKSVSTNVSGRTQRLSISNGAGDDQKRVATPRSAIESGADFIVVGRPILESKDPAAVAKKIEQEITSVMSKEL